ncbi:transposable element Tcb1 transposase [Trichonephila clavipes]|nr:transposable element Tcb1 transposase [Trichonephila clavipes]
MSFTRRPGSGYPRQTSRREDHHIVRNAQVLSTVSSVDIQAQVAPSLGAPVFRTIDESRFNLSSDDNRVRVWRPRGERLNPAFALQQHTTPTACVMVWGAIAYKTRSSLVLIRDTMTAQRYVRDILQPHVMPLMQRLSEAIFQQDNARPHTARVSQDCLCTVTTLHLLARIPDLSPNRAYLGSFGTGVEHPTSLNELGVRLLQIWNEMSPDIIQNLYASMSDRIASCIRARWASAGVIIEVCVLVQTQLGCIWIKFTLSETYVENHQRADYFGDPLPDCAHEHSRNISGNLAVKTGTIIDVHCIASDGRPSCPWF